MTTHRTKSGLMGISATPNFFRFQRASNGDLNQYGAAFVPQGFAAGGALYPVDNKDPNSARTGNDFGRRERAMTRQGFVNCLRRMTMQSQWLAALLLMAATLVLTNGIVAGPSSGSPSPTDGVQVIDVIAKKFEFDPSPIRVKQGTKVQLKITATDHAHGFRIREFPDGVDTKGKAGLVFSSPLDCQKIEKDQTLTVEFVAQIAGTYPFRCCVHCGWQHRGMKGQLIVEQ